MSRVCLTYSLAALFFFHFFRQLRPGGDDAVTQSWTTRLAAERLAAVDPLPDIMPLAKIRPNLAQGKDAEPFDLKKNASSMPDSGELQVTFQMMHVPGKHAPRQRVEYTLNMAEKKDQEIAKNLRLKVCELMHDAFALNPKTQKPVSGSLPTPASTQHQHQYSTPLQDCRTHPAGVLPFPTACLRTPVFAGISSRRSTVRGSTK